MDEASEMEALARDLAGFVAGRCAGAWLQAHGLETGTLDGDLLAAQADIARRVEEARRADAAAGPQDGACGPEAGGAGPVPGGGETEAPGAAEGFEAEGPVLWVDLRALTASVGMGAAPAVVVPISPAMARAGFRCGDRLRVRVEGAGR